MNERSSRSHTILRILIQSQKKDKKLAGIRVSCLNLVDLAGSERAAHTGAEGKRLKEGGSINKSLLALATVIGKLSEEGGDRGHIPYRNSKITRILQPSLGGNARTLIICTVTPSAGFIDETISTLKFASRAKSIRNKPTVNEIVTDNILIKQYREEINLLKTQLNQIKSSPVVRSDRHQEVTFLASDEFRQSYPYSNSQNGDLILCSLSSTQCDDIKQSMKATARLLKLIADVKDEVASNKTRMLTIVQDMKFKSDTDALKAKEALRGLVKHALALQQQLASLTQDLESQTDRTKTMEALLATKESEREEVATRLATEEQARKDVESRLSEQESMRERLSSVLEEEQEKKESLLVELTASKSSNELIARKLDSLVGTCAFQFQLSPTASTELKGLVSALTLSPKDFGIADFLTVLEDVKEGEIKKVYNELRGVFEEGRETILEEVAQKSTALSAALEKQENAEARVLALTRELETRTLELEKAQKIIDAQNLSLATKDAGMSEIELLRK
ncbi:hypothetical protein HDU98_005067, partial [Podochytrium sp. JEL0797]